MFYPLVTRLYSSLADNLMKEGHLDQAKGVLKKYDDVMPGIIPSTEVAVRKYYMTESAYRLGDIALANKLANQVDDYVTNLLDYNYALLQRSETELDNRDIQYSMSILSGLASFTKDFKQISLNAKFNAQLKNYEGKFGAAPKQ
jgi:prenyltransferase beta subunit